MVASGSGSGSGSGYANYTAIEIDTVFNMGVACGWGLVSALSLIIGAAIGIVAKPGPLVTSGMMAFGGGALIEALTIELFGAIMHHQEEDGIGGTLIAIAAAVFGGVFFSALNKVLNDQGAFMRKRSTLKHGMMSAINRTKVALIDRLKIVPMFHHLPTSDLKKLTHQMRRKVYRMTGSVVYSYADQHDGVNDHHAVIFFVLRGSVRVTIYQDEDTDPSAAAADSRPREDFYLTKDRIFGDVGLLSGIAAACEVTTISPNTKVLQIESRSLHQWISQHPRVRRHMKEMGAARLRDTRLFKELPPAVLSELAECMQDSEVSKGEVLFEAIDEKSPIILILLGIVDLKLSAASSAFRSNDILGLHHYIYGQELRVEAVVRVPTRILTIARADLDRLTAKHKPLKDAVALYQASTWPDSAAADHVRLWGFSAFVSPLNGASAPNGNVPPPPPGWPPELLRRLLAPQVPPEAQVPQGGSPVGGDKPPSPSFARFSLHRGLTRGLSLMKSSKKLQRLSMASRGSMCGRSGEGDDAPGGANRRAQRDLASGAGGSSGEPPPTAPPKRRLRFFEDNTLGHAQEKAQESRAKHEGLAQEDLGKRQDSSFSLAGVAVAAGALREQKSVPNPARSRRTSTINRSLRFAESRVQDLDSDGEMRGLSLRCIKPRLKQCLHGYPSLADYGWKAEPEVEAPRRDTGWIQQMARGAIQTSKQAPRTLGQFMPFARGADLPPTETQKLYRHIANLLDDLQLHSDETQGLRSRENLEEQLHEHVEDAHGNGGSGKVRRVRLLLYSCPARLLRFSQTHTVDVLGRAPCPPPP